MCGDLQANITCQEDAVGTFIQPILVCLTMVLIITGNLLTMIVIIRETKLHTITFVYVFNLAIADFLVGFVTQPLSFYYSITCQWPGGRDGFFCQFTGFAMCAFCSVSILSLGLISGERYLYIVHPFTHQNIRLSHAFISCVIAWSCGIFASIFPVVGLWEGVGLQPYNALYSIQWQIEPIYIICIIVFICLPSFGMIIITYTKILKLAIKAKESRAKVNVLDKNINVKDGKESNKYPVMSLRQLIAQKKSTITITILIGTFMVCWTPYILNVVVQSIRCEINPFWVNAISQWLCTLNSGCNPVVYGLTNRKFRDGVRKLFRLPVLDNRVFAFSDPREE